MDFVGPNGEEIEEKKVQSSRDWEDFSSPPLALWSLGRSA
jgi:hypothetical protein